LIANGAHKAPSCAHRRLLQHITGKEIVEGEAPNRNMTVNVISQRLSTSENLAQKDIQALKGELLMAKGIFNPVFLSTLYSIMQDSILLLSGDQRRALPWRSTFLKQEATIVLKLLLHCLSPPTPHFSFTITCTLSLCNCCEHLPHFCLALLCQQIYLTVQYCRHRFQLRIITWHVLSGLIGPAGLETWL